MAERVIIQKYLLKQIEFKLTLIYRNVRKSLLQILQEILNYDSYYTEVIDKTMCQLVIYFHESLEILDTSFYEGKKQ